uniref:Uncharacterized protein n=1 Tax=Helianthus annuus TaxID=4232 RepID=A0A251S5H7_HELAN
MAYRYIREERRLPYLMSPYAIGRVKFDAFEPERWFHLIVAFIHSASLSLQLCRNTRGTKNLFGSRICVCADEDLCFYIVKLFHFQVRHTEVDWKMVHA